MSEPIKFYKGEETGIVHESYNDINTSLFKDQYIKALNEIGAYLDAADIWSKSHTIGDEFDINNIFAFVGERGSGKTSCMESVANMLQIHFDKKESSSTMNKKFLLLDIIDPTTFDNKTNILEAIVGMLYDKFDKNETNQNGLYEDLESKENVLISNFQKVKECIKFISRQYLLNDDNENLSQLSDMASVLNLNICFEELIQSYLDYFGKNMLVVQIDDIDLQSKYAYQMVEQIRKYFVQYNVIILIAVKIEQLSKVIELEITKEYLYLLQTKRISAEEITDMATRYLIKFLPEQHRCYLPEADFYFGTELEYYKKRESEERNLVLLNGWTSVKYAITELLYRKCRYLFYNSKGVTSLIVPHNLRELRHLFYMLYEMKDYYEEGYKLSEFQEANKKQFLNYFHNDWVASNINPKDKKIVDSILKIKDAAAINKEVLRLIHIKYNNTILRADAFPEIFEETNASYNVSIADVYVVLDYLKKRVNTNDDRALLFFIETYYSTKLYAYYEEMTYYYHNDAKSDDKPEDKQKNKERIVNESIRKREVIDGNNNYELLIGGRFINTDYYTLTPIEQSTDMSRDHRPISLVALRNMIDKMFESDEVDINKLRMAEFFALCTSRIYDSRGKAINDKFRTYNELCYKVSPVSRYESIQFDLGAFFFNVIDIKKSYDKIDFRLFDIAKGEPKSLYGLLLEFCNNNRKYPEKQHSLLSCICIRNYEILSDFIGSIQYDRLKRSPSGSNTKNLKRIFNLITLYNIFTYDLNEGGDSYKRWRAYNDINGLDSELISDDNLDYVIDSILKRNEFINQFVDNSDDTDVMTPSVIEFSYAKIISEALSSFDEGIFDSIFSSLKEENVIKKHTKKNNNIREFTEFDPAKIMEIMPPKDPIALSTFRYKVKISCKSIFDKRGITYNWTQLDIFKGKIGGKTIYRQEARNLLEEFKIKYKL